MNLDPGVGLSLSTGGEVRVGVTMGGAAADGWSVLVNHLIRGNDVSSDVQ